LVVRISSAPKGDPWAAAVSVNFGEGHPMWLRRTSRVGLASGPSVGYSMASRMAASSPSTSLAISPRLRTFHPYASKRSGTLSL
jgi:hypothetical protein